MPPREPPLAALDRLLTQGDMEGALRVADALIAQSKRSFPGRLGRAAANLHLGNLVEADADVEAACRLAPTDPQAQLLRGLIDQRLGRADRAVATLGALASSKAPQAIEGGIALLETLWFAHRHDELRARLASGGAWSSDPRARLAHARLRGIGDPEGALADLEVLLARERSQVVRRVAGFEAVALLDRLGRHREAYLRATRLHAESTPPFDLYGMLEPVRELRTQLEKGGLPAARPGSPPLGPGAEARIALVVALPRSGTTLLEQMLDRHPAIAGIGEYEGVDRIVGDLVAAGRWPRGLSPAPRASLVPIRERYLSGAARLRRPDATWSFDKTLRAWRVLPAVAAVLPDACCFHVARDPRDVAISVLLSHFHPVRDGWTASLATIREVLEAERAILPRALGRLGLAHESIVYEDLVADPRCHAERCLARLGLAMDERVLAPEANARAVFTLSHAQVRRPIHRGSIGRWRNYEFAFDGSWDALAEAHDARRSVR